jgi:hypothetical protein
MIPAEAGEVFVQVQPTHGDGAHDHFKLHVTRENPPGDTEEFKLTLGKAGVWQSDTFAELNRAYQVVLQVKDNDNRRPIGTNWWYQGYRMWTEEQVREEYGRWRRPLAVYTVWFFVKDDNHNHQGPVPERSRTAA